MELQTANKALLSQRFPLVAKALVSCGDLDNIEILESKNGDAVPRVKDSGRGLLLHSRFDPQKEAERFIGEISSFNYDLFIVFGLGFAYHIEALLKKLDSGSQILVIERDPIIIKSLLINRDISSLLKDSRFNCALAPKEEDLAQLLKGKSSNKVTFLTHRGSHQTAPDYYNSMVSVCKSFLSTKEVNIATLAKFEKIWASNIARNSGDFLNASGVNIFYNRFQEFSAVVVGAGPSLTDSLPFLKRVQKGALIIAVDTAYKILIEEGIIPHFCLAVDPQLINARYFEGMEDAKSILVTDPTVHPTVLRFYKGPMVFTGVAFELMKWIEDAAGNKGEITHGGSVSTNAFDFARRLGVKKIILCGQDLAFTSGLAHARGSYLDEQQHLVTSRIMTVQMFNRRQVTALPKIMVRGIHGKEVWTNQKMMVFYNWFQKQKDSAVVNATGGGALIPGIPVVNSEDLVSEIGNADPNELLEAIFKDKSVSSALAPAASDRLIQRIDRMVSEAKTLIPVLERAIEDSGSLQKVMAEPEDRRDGGKIAYILKRLAETDNKIDSMKDIKGFLSFTIQRVLHTVTEGYDIDESDSSLSNEELTAKKSHFLYSGLLEGTNFNIKVLGRMISSINPHRQ